MEGIDYITCKICNRKLKTLKKHLHTHNITWKEYSKKYSIIQANCSKYKESLSSSKSGKNNGMYGVRRFEEENPFYNKKHTQESLDLMSKNRKGVNAGENHWLYNKGYLVTGEKNPNFGPNENLKGEKNPFYNCSHTEETINKLKNDPRCISMGFKGKHHSYSSRKILSEKATERYQHLWSITGIHSNIFFHSSYECMFLEICRKVNIKVERANKFRTSYYHEGKRKWYVPDFYLPKFNCIVEVKGFEPEIDKKKEKFFKKKHSYLKYKKIQKEELKWLLNKLNISKDIKTYKGVIFYNESKVSKKSSFL